MSHHIKIANWVHRFLWFQKLKVYWYTTIMIGSNTIVAATCSTFISMCLTMLVNVEWQTKCGAHVQ